MEIDYARGYSVPREEVERMVGRPPTDEEMELFRHFKNDPLERALSGGSCVASIPFFPRGVPPSQLDQLDLEEPDLEEGIVGGQDELEEPQTPESLKRANEEVVAASQETVEGAAKELSGQAGPSEPTTGVQPA